MIRRSLAAFAIAVALGCGAAAQVHAGGIPPVDIQVEVSRPDVCDAVKIYQCQTMWEVTEIQTSDGHERVSMYPDQAHALQFINNLMSEFTIATEFHVGNVYMAIGHGKDRDYVWIDADDQRAVDGVIAVGTWYRDAVTSVDVEAAT